MKMFDDHPELIEGERTTFKFRSSRSRVKIATTQPHRHRPPICCGEIFTRPMTEAEHQERKDG
jgi:hypothetical protein